jgi:hypothetical protein
MAFTLIQAGANLQFINEDGSVSAPLTLPPGVTLSTLKTPRFHTFTDIVVLVNTPSQPLTIDGNGIVRTLAPLPPRLAPVLAAVNGGTLSGTYNGVRYTFIVTDDFGNIIAESGYSPASSSVTIANKFLQASNLDLSPDNITGRRLYRPTSDGAVLFEWIDLDGNVITSVADDLSDAELSLVAAPVLGTPPYLTHIADFRGRLFGVPGDQHDYVLYSEAGVRYAWPASNSIPIGALGSDSVGITALAARRDALGCARREQIWQITGTGTQNVDGTIDFDTVRLSENLGILDQGSVAIYRDTVFWLWYDGVYIWNDTGLHSITDDKVRSWFTKDDTFNRELFSSAFAYVDPIRLKYRLFLAAAGSNVIDRWIEYDLKTGTWWGPHKTDAFAPTSVFSLAPTITGSNLPPVLGSGSGFVFQEQDTRTDGAATAIDFEVISQAHDAAYPDQEKYFGKLSMLYKPMASGTLTVRSRVGDLGTANLLTQTFDLTKARDRKGRLGTGKWMLLEYANAEVGVDVAIEGFELDNVHTVGRR